MAVQMKSAETLDPGAPTALFQTRIPVTVRGGVNSDYDVNADCAKFLFLISEAERQQASIENPIIVIQNWTVALKR
jgi:hypothetical protein